MTNELGTTLQDIETKAERKNKVLTALHKMYDYSPEYIGLNDDYKTIRKYIEEN